MFEKINLNTSFIGGPKALTPEFLLNEVSTRLDNVQEMIIICQLKDGDTQYFSTPMPSPTRTYLHKFSDMVIVNIMMQEMAMAQAERGKPKPPEEPK